MNRLIISLLILAVTSVAFAKSVDSNTAIQATAHPDGVLFQVNGPDVDLQLSVAGPGNVAFARTYANADSVFLNIKDAQGKTLADGLYKYEARPVPVVIITRAESAKMPDRNVLHGKTDAKISPFSGTFRIFNGKVVDPNDDEFGNLLPTETEK